MGVDVLDVVEGMKVDYWFVLWVVIHCWPFNLRRNQEGRPQPMIGKTKTFVNSNIGARNGRKLNHNNVGGCESQMERRSWGTLMEQKWREPLLTDSEECLLALRVRMCF